MQFGFRVSRVQVLQRTETTSTPSGRNAVHLVAWNFNRNRTQSGYHASCMTRIIREARVHLPCAPHRGNKP